MLNKDLEDKLLQFLDGKDPKESYAYTSSTCCAAAQFNESIGRRYPLSETLIEKHDPTTFDGQLEKAASESPHTFGGLRKRIKELV